MGDIVSGQDVDIISALPAGTNVIGKVGIDQTTPGTTNGVVTPDQTASGSFTGSGQAVTITLNGAGDSMLVSLTGNIAFTGTVVIEGSVNGTDFNYALPLAPLPLGAAVVSAGLALSGANASEYLVRIAGFAKVRARCSAYTSGTLTVALRTTTAQTFLHNVSHVGGAAVDTNSGTKSGGTQRIVLATDQPAFSTAGLMSVKTDQTTHGTTDLVAADIVKVNGNAALAGNGVTGTGSPRVTIASDNTPFPIKIDQTTPGTTNKVAANITDVPVSTAGTPAGVTVSTSAVSLKASNASRKAIVITNNGVGILYIGHTSGVTASGSTMGMMVVPGGSYQDSGFGLYTGDLYGIYDQTASSQNVSVSERT